MRKTVALLTLALTVALFAAEAARADELVVETPTEEASFPFFCDWGYDWEERCYWDTWSPRLSIGGDRDKVWRAGLRFALPGVPAGSDVGRARLFLYYDRVCVGVYGSSLPCDGRRWELEVVPILGEWFDEREPELGFPSAWLTIEAGALEGWLSFDVTDLVTEWVQGSLERDGLLVKLVDAQEVYLGSGPSPPGRLFPDPALHPRLEVEFLRPDQ